MQPNAKILSLRMTSISLGLVETSVSTGTEISPSPILDVIATPTKTKTLHKFWHPASRTACRRIGILQHPVHRTSRRRRRGDMDTWLQALEMDPQNRIWGWKMETREKTRWKPRTRMFTRLSKMDQLQWNHCAFVSIFSAVFFSLFEIVEGCRQGRMTWQ